MVLRVPRPVRRLPTGRRLCRLAVGLVVLVGLPALLAPPSPAAATLQPAPGRQVLGYYVPYDPTSWASLQAHPEALDLVAAQWVTIDPCGGIGSRDDQTLKRFVRAHGRRLLPSLLTSSAWLNHRLLADPDVSAHAVDEIVAYTLAEGYDGFDLDLEGVAASDRDAYTDFVARLGAALHERGLLLTLALPAKERDVTIGWAGAYDYAALGAEADLITLMTYEYHGTWSGPGSVAPYAWVQRVIAFASSQMPPEKLLLGLAFYGYDWNTTSGGARALGYAQAAALADQYAVPIELDPASQSARFGYQGLAGEPLPAVPAVAAPMAHLLTTREPAACPVVPPPPPPAPRPTPAPEPGMPQAHAVWLEDSDTAAARLGLVDQYGLAGVATWRLGLEDPRVWDLFQDWRSGTPES